MNRLVETKLRQLDERSKKWYALYINNSHKNKINMGFKEWLGIGAAAAGAAGGMNSAEASTRHHEKMEDRSAVVEKAEATGMNAAIKFALEKAQEGKDEATGTITEGAYTVSFQKEEKGGPLIATVTVEEGGKKETKRIIVGEMDTGIVDKGNKVYKKVAMGDADELDQMAKLKEGFKEMEAVSDNENGKIASEE
jgi:hypothetical protein